MGVEIPDTPCSWAGKCWNSEGKCQQCNASPFKNDDRCVCGPGANDWIKPGTCSAATVMWKFQTLLVLGPASVGTPRANASSAMRALSKTTIVASAAQVRMTGSNQAHARHATMWKFQTPLV